MSLAQAGWRPCFGDIGCYLQLDSTGMMVGQLYNNPWGHISVIKYKDGHHHEEKYRDFGYGLKLAEATTSTDLGPSLV